MDVPCYFVVAFDRDPEGNVIAGEAKEMPNAGAAQLAAGALAILHAGALAFA